jgi:hypothetical protein
VRRTANGIHEQRQLAYWEDRFGREPSIGA